MLASEIFVDSVDYAMLQFSLNQAAQIVTPQDACAVGYRMQGAHEFLATLKNISSEAVAPRPRISDNLDTKA